MDMSIGFNLKKAIKRSGPSGAPVNSAFAKLLLHFDSDFSDSSLENRTPTLIGSPVIDTGDKVFGEGSGYMADKNRRVEYPGGSDFHIADGVPWQLSFRMLSPAGRVADNVYICGNNNDWNGAGWTLWVDTWTRFWIISNSGQRVFWDFTWSEDVWKAIRLNYDGTNYRLYEDGVLIATKTATNILDGSALPFAVGGRPSVSNFGSKAFFDEFLWEKHVDLVVTSAASYVVETGPYVLS
jgi:hypothetical protein